MSAQHTPGPWKIDPRNDDDADILPDHVSITAPDHAALAQVVWKMEGHERSPTCEANAMLIAAAPALLEALQKIEAALRSDPPHGPQKYIVGDELIYRIDGQRMYHAINAARDAIALVTVKP